MGSNVLTLGNQDVAIWSMCRGGRPPGHAEEQSKMRAACARKSGSKCVLLAQRRQLGRTDFSQYAHRHSVKMAEPLTVIRSMLLLTTPTVVTTNTAFSISLFHRGWHPPRMVMENTATWNRNNAA